MVRKLLVMVVLFTVLVTTPPTYGAVTIDEEHFPDPTFRVYISRRFDTDADGVLSATEINKASVVKVNYSLQPVNGGIVSEDKNFTPITSLKGIEYLVSLAVLDCDHCEILELDLSNSYMLKQVKCSNNSLVSLKLAGCSALTTLDCSNNFISELTLTDCPFLDYLNCANNRLQFLDLGNNPMLAKLDIDSNGLTELDVSSNSKLTYLHCKANYLSTLNLTRQPILVDLDCRFNQIAELNLSSNRGIRILKVDQSITTGGLTKATDADPYIFDLTTLVDPLNLGNVQPVKPVISKAEWLLLDPEQQEQTANLDTATGIASFPIYPALFAYDYGYSSSVGKGTMRVTIHFDMYASNSPIVSAPSELSAVANLPYTYTFATNSTSVRWSLDDGVLPRGLSLSPTGTISGVPLETGSFSVRVKATSSGGATTTITCTFHINNSSE